MDLDTCDKLLKNGTAVARVLSLGVGLCTTGCAGWYSPDATTTVPTGATETWTPRPPHVDIEGQDMSPWQGLLDETERVVKTPAFRRHLEAYGHNNPLKTGPWRSFIDGRTTLAIYYGVESPPRQLPVSLIHYQPTSDLETGLTGPNGHGAAEMHLANVVLRRWLSADETAKSCAINTVAHELTHTIVDTNGKTFFVDAGFTYMWLLPGKHLVSYTVGTVAQCTYLEERGEDYSACVETRGTAKFSSDGCDNGLQQ